MNKSYRSIWCEKTGTFVAAAETSRAKGKKPSSGVVATAIVSAVGVAAFMAPQMALALTHGSSLVLCNQSANSGGGYSWGPGGTSKQVGCGPGSNPFGDGTQSFQLGNAGNDSGAANGEAQTAYVAGFSDGTLVLGGTNGVHVRAEMDLDNHTITNLKQGAVSATSKDAINGSQLYATNQSIANLDDRVTNVYEKGTKYFHANSTGTDSSATAQDAVAIGVGTVSAGDYATAAGPYAKASEFGATALGNVAKALGSKSTAIGFNTNATGAAAVALGDTAGAT
ncbi:ESPR-type extended signal peptide-containing protein, partial [Paraburkholderia sp. EG304]|uniref:ESPR-type extended signal peptide-containing protein n=1 Tax=Paraburkholderia sp. EG304 TaxID=3237015 RepID=UPI00397E4624